MKRALRWLGLGPKSEPYTPPEHPMNRNDIRPGLVDPTLEKASREIAAQIEQKAEEIKTISDDIVLMTKALLEQFKSRPNDEDPPK